ncbi:MAG TPA: DUF1330 domain-containing protein [Steroidobacteraceae bacterium]|jgi:uncharacterized protein (DUF1330 family)|nr:DUF1330 domain-containing protein [Steroidobacteraceae bacterium]
MAGATIVVVGRFRSGYRDVFDAYSKRARAFLDKKGGVVIRRQVIERTLYGLQSADLVMMIDFANIEVAASAFFEQEYLDIVPLRDRVFSEFQMHLALPDQV